MTQRDIRTALRNFDALVRQIATDTDDPSDMADVGHFIGRNQIPLQIWLSKKQNALRSTIVEDLYRALGAGQTWSRKELGRLLDNALVETLAPMVGNPAGSELSPRLESVTTELAALLASPPHAELVITPVSNVDPSSLPGSLLGIRLLIGDEALLKRLELTLQQHLKDVGKKIDFLRGVAPWGDAGVYAELKVRAGDYAAALALARARIRRVFDIVNCLIDLDPYNHSWLALPGELSSVRTVSFQVRDDGSISYPHDRVGPMGLVHLAKLKERSAALGMPFHLIEELVEEDSVVANALIRAMQWCGRASVRRAILPAESMLLYMVALETLVLADNPQGQLSSTLRERIIRLADLDPEQVTPARRTLNRLIKCRNKLLHAGHGETDTRLSEEAREFALLMVCRFANDPALRALRDRESFSARFADVPPRRPVRRWLASWMHRLAALVRG